jgi:hypothetical protein
MISQLLGKSVRSALGVCLLALAQGACAGEFDGQWELKDTSGKIFEIWLRADGRADGTHNEAMKHGSWAEEGGAAVIHWDTGWTTRIARDGQGYRKTAYKPGATLTDKPANSSEARRIGAPGAISGKK